MAESLIRVLCIDDDEDILVVAAMALEDVGGLSVLTSTEGADAVALAEEYNPDLILLDYMMPGLDGPSTMAAVRAVPALDKIPIAFMTARVRPEELKRYIEAGASGVVPKPFDPMTLADDIRLILEQAQESELNQTVAS